MKRLSLVILTSLALGGIAMAEDKATSSGSSGSEMQKTDKMKGPPNADGAHKDGAADTTGTAGGGAAAAKSTGEADGSSGHKK